jgi:hypothetical protein
MPLDGSFALALSGNLRIVHEPIVNSLVSKRIADIFLNSLIILIRIPLAIVQKRLAIQGTPQPVYRLGGHVPAWLILAWSALPHLSLLVLPESFEFI